MFPIRSENEKYLQAHNIRLSELKPSTIPNMAQQPRKLVHLPKVRMISRGPRPASGIRVTHVKSIKPPDPELVKKNEEEKLREQLQKEIVSRSRACAYKGYECTLPVISGRQYCYSHITRDPTAPYRQCSHTNSDGERCQEPAPKEREHRDQSLCFEHARAALHSRHRATAPPPPVSTTETLLNQLQHYVRPERPRTTSCASSVSVVSDPAEQDQTTPTPVDPFKQIDATAQNSAYSSSIMECCSASDSDNDSVTVDDCYPIHEALSEPEDVPSEELPLWRAGVFTAEEAVSEAKNTLKSLQSAYLRQMDRLRTLLFTARRRYLNSLKAEREQYCSINSQARSGPLSARERRQLKQLKAFASYRRTHGVNAVLARKLTRKRTKRDSHPRTPSVGRCVHTDGARCSQLVLPAAKHCHKHILHDRHQVLFSACGDSRGLSVCGEPIAKLPLPSTACRYHTNPPVYTAFTLKKDDSDSDTESRSSMDSHREIEDNRPPPSDVFE